MVLGVVRGLDVCCERTRCSAGYVRRLVVVLVQD